MASKGVYPGCEHPKTPWTPPNHYCNSVKHPLYRAPFKIHHRSNGQHPFSFWERFLVFTPPIIVSIHPESHYNIPILYILITDQGSEIINTIGHQLEKRLRKTSFPAPTPYFHANLCDRPWNILRATYKSHWRTYELAMIFRSFSNTGKHRNLTIAVR